MRRVELISEAEMVAVFLKTEIESLRFKDRILSLLGHEGVDRKIIDCPDLNDPGENDARGRLLGEWRGYRRGGGVFCFYPDNPTWYRCMIHRVEIPAIQYINDSYWTELSGGSRLLGDAADHVRRGALVYGQSTEWALTLAEEAARGVRFPEPILVSPGETCPLTVLEGHARMTAYCLALNQLPDELSVIVGFGPEFAYV